MKWTRLLKADLNSELLNISNWEAPPTFEKRGHIFFLKGKYKTSIIKRIPGDSGEKRLWTEDHTALGNWTQDTTKKYIDETKKEGIKQPIVVQITNNKATIWEGNHRKMLASYLRIKYVPIIVRCYDTQKPTKNLFGILEYIK